MREVDEFAMENFDPPQDKITRTETTDEVMKPKPAGRKTGRFVACLAGALLVVLAMFGAPSTSSARVNVGIVVSFGPPALPVYAQPPCPAPGYIWTPGYWAWDPAYGYYWVPGTWVPAPFVGALWTPGYWDFDDGGYRWHRGYWGLSVGFYGGINYGYGYTGFGYYGGYWRGGRFFYNRAVNRIMTRNITHVYYRGVREHTRFRHVSYHGGPGGTIARATRAQMAAARTRRYGPVRSQVRHARFARSDPALRARANRGRPGIAATPRPGRFRGNGIERATRAGAPYREPARRANGRSAPYRTFNRQENRRAPSANARRYTEPRGRVQRSDPARGRAERAAPRYDQGARQRAERPTNRSYQHASIQRGRPQERPSQARRAESQGRPEGNTNHGRSGNDHGGNGRGHGHGR